MKRPDSYLYFATFFIITTLAFANAAVPANDKTFVNAPIVLSKFFAIFSLFMMVVTAAIMGSPLYRDLEYKTYEYYLSFPINKNGYFWGRFVGSFLFVLIIGSTLLWGSMLGPFLGIKLGWLSADRVAPFHLVTYVRPFLMFALPNLFLTSSFFFALVAYTRNSKAIYTGGVIFYLGYVLSVFAGHYFANKNLVYYLDAFGFVPITLQEPFLSPEKTSHLQIPFHGLMLVNRLLWTGIGLLTIFLTWWLFSFTRFFSGAVGKKRKQVENPDLKQMVRKIPRVSVAFTGSYNRRTILALAKIEWLSIIRDNYFRIILGVGILFLGFLFWMGGGRQFNVPDLPRTSVLLDIYNHNFIFFIFIILLFYTGETLHRERTTQFAIINDALPPSDFILYGSKLVSLFLLAILLATVPMIVGIIVQLLKGFTLLNVPLYIICCYGLTLPMYVEMVMFAFAVHVLVNNKFAGHAVGMMIFVGMLLVSSTGRFDYRLLLYSYTPDYWITDMDGLGPSVAPQLWFNVYWILAGCILVLIGAMFYYRGMLANFSERIKLAADRFKGAPVKIAVLLLIGFFSTGFYNYYNVSYLNEWLTRRELAERQVAYEKQLKKYSVLPLPKLKKVRLYIDIFPVERKIISRAVVTIINSDRRPINKILLEYDHVTTYSVLYNGRQIPFTQPLVYPWPKFTFFKRGMDTSMNRLYELSTPLMPGDTAVMEVFSALSTEGFTNNYSALAVQHSATAFNDYLPELGYDEGDEMKLYSKRKEYGLPPRPDDKLPDAGDSAGIRRLFFTPFSSLIDFEATVSTSSDQFAIAPGILDSTWKDKNRNYFHYTMNDPKTYEPFPIFSAKYSVIHDSVTLANGKTVCIEIDYHKTHTANLDRFLEATKEGLTYFSRAFGNYPFHEMRVIEGPGFIRAGDFPNIIAYPESYAWNASFTDPGELDYCYFVTAMHLGRQWWRFQVAPNNTQGSQVISSGLSKYGALMLYEKRYGKNNMKELLNSENSWYLFSHRFIFEKENPLLNASKEYVWDTKAGIIFYALQDLMGENSFNAALREFYMAYSYRDQPPYAGSADLLKVLKNRVPDSLQYFLSDGFDKITLYDNKIIKATVSPYSNNNEFKVHLEIVARKVYADTSGKEADAALMNDYIDIGIFTSDTKDKNGRTIAAPLYLMKHKVSAGKHVIDVIVKGKPVRAGIDPYNRLVDKNLADNTISISN